MSMEPQIQAGLDKVLQELQQVPIVKEYQAIEAKVLQHDGLLALEEMIKSNQRDAVNFAHYGKTEAEKQALKAAEEARQQYEQHPLVVAYREKLVAVDALLHYLTDKIQYQVNDRIEKESETPGA